MGFHFGRSLVSRCMSTALLTGALVWSQSSLAQELRLQPHPFTLAELRLANANLQPPASSSPVPLLGGELSTQNSTRSGTEAQRPANTQDSTESKEKESADTQENQANTSERNDQQRSSNALTPLQNRQLSIPVQVVDLSVAGLGTGVLPESAAEKREKQTTQLRGAAYKHVHWHPSEICHFPLRFEETMLERHGHVRFGCWQPLASGVRFFATLPMLPYLYTLQPSCEPVYALGNYRPGTCAPLLRDSLPYDKHAAVVEAMSLAGFFWAMPL